MINSISRLLLPSVAFVAALLICAPDNTAYGQALMQKALKTTADHIAGAHLAPVRNPANTNLTNTAPQQAAAPARRNGPQNGPGNYKTFSAKKKNNTVEAMVANRGYERHPEIGMLFAEAPCDNCYELIGKRTETTKTFLKEGTSGTDGGKDIMVQTASGPMHYKDAAGNWRTITSELEADGARPGIYAATEQPVPVVINTNRSGSYSSIGKEGQKLEFNHNLELVYTRPDGNEVSLGAANWTKHTAGDDGVFVTDAWPGVDIEMHTVRGAVKTNFYINHAMPEYAEGKLMIRDHLQMDNGLTLFTDGKNQFAGNIEVRDDDGKEIYIISSATACEKQDIRHTLKLIDYHINGNTLDIAVPGEFLNRSSASYPVIIDPLVSTATVSAVNGSSYSAALAAMSGCAYYNAATTPANCTITDIRYAFVYVTNSVAYLSDGALDFYITGGCRSPLPPTGFGGSYWFCNLPSPGTCTADGTAPYSLFSDFGGCIPPPQCAAHDLGITMYFYETWATKPACGTLYITSGSPLTITVYGHTVEFVSATAGPASICLGSSSTLTGSGTYGVPPYTYSWTPGPLAGSSVVVSPGTTTLYNLTITDACGITATGSTTVTVITEAPITGTLSLCVGNTTTLADATGGAHTWTSSNPGVATITSPGGVVTAVAAGTTTIRYTTTATGCFATAVLTVTPLPTPILGTLSVCAGSTTSLSDATSSGPWTSSNTAVATISASGLVSGISAGTATITCGNATCYVTAIVTVNGVAAIGGTLTVCQGNTTTLNDATAGGTWSSGNPGVATIIVGTGVVTGVSGGTATITYTTAAGCTRTAVVTVNPVAPINGILSLCAGSTTTLTDAVAGGTWSSGTPGVATIGAGSGLVTAVTNGTTTIVYTTAAGCPVSVVVTVNPLSPISGTLTVCQGNTTTLTDAAAGGTWTSGTPGVATIGAGTGLVTGIAGGTSTIVYTTGAGCSVSAVVTVNPVAPIGGTLTLCAGSTSTLTDAVAGGTWSSGTPGVATIGVGTGLVTAIANGTTTIIYTTTAGCPQSVIVTVNPLAAISGTLTVCVGGTTTLTDVAAGGTWTSGTPSVATIGAATGIVTGLSGGTTTIVYTTGAGCSVNAIVTVNPITPISGVTTTCAGHTSTLTDATTGGTWSSTSPGVATISGGGVVSGIATGTTTISYIMPSGCYVTTTFTVINVGPINGTPVLCVGATTTLTDATAGGTWASGSPGIASVGIGTGTVSGLAAGTTVITYTSPGGCFSTIVITVNAIPSAITGVNNVCAGLTTTLSDISPGGVWTSSNPGVATVSGSVVVTGVTPGVITVTYTLAGGCFTTIPFNVNPLPAAIGGPATVCLGTTINLVDASAGGTWVSGNTAVATIDAVGTVSGIAAGSTTITYTLATGCKITRNISVLPLSAAPLTENVDYCQNDVAIPLTATGVSLMWYTVPSGGVGSALAPVPPTTIPGVTTWYVSQNLTGCEGGRAPLNVTVHIRPVFSIIPARPTACQDDTISFAYSGPTFPGETFSWTLPSNGVLYGGSSLYNPSITMYYDTVLGANYVMLTVGDGFAACNVTDTIAMTVYINSPQAAFYVKPDICVGDTVTIALTSIGPGVTDYNWDFGGATMVNASSNHGGPFLVSWPTAGIYSVTLTVISNLNCPSAPIRDTVDVHGLPDAAFAVNPKNSGALCLEDSILFIAHIQNPNWYYLWEPLHCFNNNDKATIWGRVEKGRTDISLTVTDPYGCKASTNQQLNPDACCSVLFPTAFTPNGDGNNDKYRPIFNGFHVFHEFRIVNRWGQTVFESANSYPEWDGNFNGVPQDMGVYYYFIRYDCGGNVVEEKGDVTLVR